MEKEKFHTESYLVDQSLPTPKSDFARRKELDD